MTRAFAVRRLVRRLRGHATVRVKLTAAYAGMLLVAGVGLITLVFVLLQRWLPHTIATTTRRAIPASRMVTKDYGPAIPTKGDTQLIRLTSALQGATFNRLLISSLIALLVFALVSVALAWWLSGRVLRPVHTITATARRLSADNLHERIALDGPPDELKELADTFDQMLDRLADMVAAQRRFVANAAHELRTPVTVQRAAAEIGLANADSPDVQRVRAKMLTVADRSRHLIDGLLMLSVSDQGLEHREQVPLHDITETVVAESPTGDITVTTDLHPAHVQGDSVLLTHLVRNLVSNAIRHNVPAGKVAVRVAPGLLEVANTGPRVPEDTISELFEPFFRMAGRHGEGAGLGLSIAASIAQAHNATITAHPNPNGGLTVTVTFD